MDCQISPPCLHGSQESLVQGDKQILIPFSEREIDAIIKYAVRGLAELERSFRHGLERSEAQGQ